MSVIEHVTSRLPEAERNRRVYAGDILVFRRFPAVAALVGALRDLCHEWLGASPERAHRRFAPDALARRAHALREAVTADAVVTERVNQVLSAVGVDLGATYGDGLKQRVQPPQQGIAAGTLAPLAAHRDTWGSNIAAQTNWWAPVFPVTARRTLALFPGLFARAVANDSADWDFAELLRRFKTEGRATRYPLLPVASDPPPVAQAYPVVLEPGDLLCFSGAHLHASVPNTTDRTRLSFEIRTVNGDHAASGHGAPNVDGDAVRIAYQLFRRLTDRRKLGAMQRRTPR